MASHHTHMRRRQCVCDGSVCRCCFCPRGALKSTNPECSSQSLLQLQFKSFTSWQVYFINLSLTWPNEWLQHQGDDYFNVLDELWHRPPETGSFFSLFFCDPESALLSLFLPDTSQTPALSGTVSLFSGIAPHEAGAKAARRMHCGRKKTSVAEITAARSVR